MMHFLLKERGIFDDNWQILLFCLGTESWYSQQLFRPPHELGNTGMQFGNFQTCLWLFLSAIPEQPACAWLLIAVKRTF